MNTQTVVGAVLLTLSLLIPDESALLLWLLGIALVGYGRGVASGIRRLQRGGDR